MNASPETVQTSEREPDLFGAATPDDALQDSREQLRMEFTGKLTHDADVRSRQCDREGHLIPVVCLDLHEVGKWRRRVHVEQPFTEATRKDAERLARSLKRGQTVTVTTPLVDVRMSFFNATVTTP